MLMLVSRPIQLTREEGLPVADTREYRIQSGRSGISGIPGFKLAETVVLSCGEGGRGVIRGRSAQVGVGGA